MKKESPDTAETDVGPKGADDDVESDKAKGTEEGVEWSDEGGAIEGGPADTGDPSQ
ncbi:MAG TPA: hypothetical protein VHI10_19095 [Mycobacterium sp.]|nr:hypothetical protein [Mycobacterium sp.]